MRHVMSGLGLGSLLLLTGCNSFSFLRHSQPAAPGINIASATPTMAELVAALNDNARRVQSLECSDVDLDCQQRLQPIGLRARLVCGKPHYFRMQAMLLGNTAVDMGSNDQEFWWWISKGDPPYLFHCSHEDFAHGQGRMPFPFQPDWIMEALGIAEYDPAKPYKVVTTRPGTIELVEEAVSPQGQPVRKVTVLSQSRNQLRVTGHLLQDARPDARGHFREICSAQVLEFQQDASGAVLPRRMQMVWPAEQIKMKMKLEGVTVNPQMTQQRMAGLFTRPVLKDVQTYDLARGLDAPAGQVRRASGQMP